jgi:hypothetical protein
MSSSASEQVPLTVALRQYWLFLIPIALFGPLAAIWIDWLHLPTLGLAIPFCISYFLGLWPYIQWKTSFLYCVVFGAIFLAGAGAGSAIVGAIKALIP